MSYEEWYFEKQKMCTCTEALGDRLHKFCLQKPKLFKLNKPVTLAGVQQHRPWATAVPCQL